MFKKLSLLAAVAAAGLTGHIDHSRVAAERYRGGRSALRLNVYRDRYGVTRGVPGAKLVRKARKGRLGMSTIR